MQTIFIVLILIAISKFICKEEDYNIFYFDKSSIETINDSNFDQVMNAGIINDYIILFTIKICEGCDEVLKALERAAEYYFKRNSNITFYKIDLEESINVDLRFHFDKVPIIIYVSKGQYAKYHFKYIATYLIKNFIEDKNKIMIDLPKELGFFGYVMKIFELVADCIILKYPYLKKYYFYYRIIVYGFFVCIIILSTYVFIQYCCISSNDNKKYCYGQFKKTKLK